MRYSSSLLFALLCWLGFSHAGHAAAPHTPSQMFGLTTIHKIHLTIPADDWQKMHPTRGGFSGAGKPPPKGAEKNDERKPRGGFGHDFEYVKAQMSIDGFDLSDVGLRFKGNSSYAVASRSLKRPFKIDLDRYIDTQSFRGVRKFVLNNGVMDSSAAREALAFALYRAAGVAAPRTAFAEVTLSVPGKYDKETVGLYILIEAIDKDFLLDRFGSKKGLLLKPERVGPLDHLGTKWDAYESRYRAKTSSSEKVQKKFMELTKLIQQPEGPDFIEKLDKLLDIDQFLRYLAVTVTLSSMDSFIGFAHNYYIYHDPKKERFQILPWDLDHSFGSLTMFASAPQLMDLSIRQPWAGRNPLVERLLKNEKTFVSYRKHLETLLANAFTAEKLNKDLAAIKKLVAGPKEREKAAISKRGDNLTLFAFSLLIGRPPELETFISKRIESLESQIAGKSTGSVVTRQFGPPPLNPQFLVKPIVKATDKDTDGKLSWEEVREGTKALFAHCDRDKKGSLELKQLTASLEKLMPKPGFFGPAIPPGFAAALARGIVEQTGKDGKVTEKGLISAAEKLFPRADRDKSNLLDEREISDALRLLLPSGPVMPAKPPEKKPAERKEASK